MRAVNQAIIRNADGSGAPVSNDPGTPGIEGVHAYKFNEGSGTTAEDSQGDADATLSGPTGWGPGVEGTAVTFDGGEADTGGSLVDTAGSYSVSAWAKLDEAGGAFQTVVSQDTGGASGFFLQYSGADQRWAFSFVGLRALSPDKPETGRWYHLVGVRDAQQAPSRSTSTARRSVSRTPATRLGRPETRSSAAGSSMETRSTT